MAKRIDEPIVAYLKAIGCKALNSPAQAFDFLDKELGPDAEASCEIIQARAERSENAMKSEDFYVWKNGTYERSRAITLLYDNCFLREVGRSLQKYRESFGKRVLDFGCDNGVLTCYLACLCPASKILGVDRCVAAVENAKRLANSLGLGNVEFSVGDADSLGRDTFDTVFTSRTAHENFKDMPYPWELPERGQIDLICSLYSEFARKIAKLVSPNGNIISVSRFDFSPAYCGRVLALVQCGFAWSGDRWSDVCCHHPMTREGDVESFQVAVLERGNQSAEELILAFCRAYRASGADINADRYSGVAAAWERIIHAGGAVFWKRLVSVEGGGFCGECVLHVDREYDDTIWLYMNNNCGDLYFERHHIEVVDELRDQIMGWVDRSTASADMLVRDILKDGEVGSEHIEAESYDKSNRTGHKRREINSVKKS